MPELSSLFRQGGGGGTCRYSAWFWGPLCVPATHPTRELKAPQGGHLAPRSHPMARVPLGCGLCPPPRLSWGGAGGLAGAPRAQHGARQAAKAAPERFSWWGGRVGWAGWAPRAPWVTTEGAHPRRCREAAAAPGGIWRGGARGPRHLWGYRVQWGAGTGALLPPCHPTRLCVRSSVTPLPAPRRDRFVPCLPS